MHDCYRESDALLTSGSLFRDRAFYSMMKVRASRQEAGEGGVTLDALPTDILGKIVRETTLRDKCSLELLNKRFHTLLSNPLFTEGLWGSCNLVADLRLVDNLQ